jgi:hypothetical protein
MLDTFTFFVDKFDEYDDKELEVLCSVETDAYGTGDSVVLIEILSIKGVGTNHDYMDVLTRSEMYSVFALAESEYEEHRYNV